MEAEPVNILVTGAAGFVGKNLCAELRNRKLGEVLEYDLNTDPALLSVYAKECDFVFHLAGVNRPKRKKNLWRGISVSPPFCCLPWKSTGTKRRCW